MTLKIDGTIEFEGRTYEATGEYRPPKTGDFFLSHADVANRASIDFTASYIILREVKLEPKYRPFANAAEFLPHANRVLRYSKNKLNHHIRVDAFNDKCWLLSGETEDWDYQYMLDAYVFADTNEPCGVLE